MRIRHILPGFGILPSDLGKQGMSGIVGVAYNLALQQADQGWDVELVGLRGGDSAPLNVPSEPRVVSIRSWPWLKAGGYDYRYFAPAYLRLLLRGQADIHHVYSNPYHLALGRARKYVLHYQTPIYEVPPAYHRAMRWADAVICCSAFVRDQLLRHVDYPCERVYVVYNGVDLGRFAPGDKRAAREKLGISAQEKVVLFAGQVNEAKGLLYLVQACRQMSAGHDLRLLVAGSSSLWADGPRSRGQSPYERRVMAAASGLKVTFLGPVAYHQMPAVYQAADIFVCPSTWDEPFGMVNVEAMATGLPVVASRVGGIPEAVVDGVTGLVVPPRDVDALVSALSRLLDDSPLVLRIGSEGVKRAREFDWQKIAREVDRVYDETGSKARESRACGAEPKVKGSIASGR